MLYLFYGLDTFLIEQEIKGLLNQHQIDELSIAEYDLDEVSMKIILDDAQTISLFDSRKAILVENASIFTATPKKDAEEDMKQLEMYMENFNPDVDLIYIVHKEKIDERKKIVKRMKQVGEVKEFNKSSNLPSLIRSLFDGYSISSSLISLFIERVGNDLNRISNEIDKIKIYKNDMVITEEDILLLTTKNMDVDIFELIDGIVSHNQEKSMVLYKEMIKRNEEPIKIIVMLANQFRIMYQARGFYAMGYSEANIAKELGIHPYRIKLALSKGKQYSDDVLLSYLGKLADMDIQIKTGKIDKTLALELFILMN